MTHRIMLCREVLEKYGNAVHKLAREILAVLSEGVGQSAELFCSKFAGLAAVAVRTGLNYYPPCPQPDLVMGASGHADVSVVTILQQGDVSGLEVLKDGCWVPVPPIPHAFVVNVGDILQVRCSKFSFYLEIYSSLHFVETTEKNTCGFHSSLGGRFSINGSFHFHQENQ